MSDHLTATVSARWTLPKPSRDGTYWRSKLRARTPDVGAIDSEAYGPDEAACVRETRRQDRAWLRRLQRREGGER